jgi:peptidoglycan hydrolase CwlO-like protein
VNPRKSAIATAALIAVAVACATGLSPTAAVARTADPKEVQELKREVNQLRAEVQALQAALAETTELERQRTANLTRALKDDSGAFQPAAASSPPAAPAPPAERSEPADRAREAAPPAAAPSGTGGDKSRGNSRHRHNRRSGRTHSTPSR